MRRFVYFIIAGYVEEMSNTGTISSRNNNKAKNLEQVELSLRIACNESLWPVLSNRGWIKEVGSSYQKIKNKLQNMV